MIKIPFCYSVKGLCEDGSAGFMKMSMDFSGPLTQSEYNEIHNNIFKMFENVNEEDITPISAKDYMENSECDEEELEELQGNFIVEENNDGV